MTGRPCAVRRRLGTMDFSRCTPAVGESDGCPFRCCKASASPCLDEHPYGLDRHDGVRCWAYEFGVSPAPGITIDPDSDEAGLTLRFTDAFRALWQGEAEVDASTRSSCGADGPAGWPSCVPATGT